MSDAPSGERLTYAEWITGLQEGTILGQRCLDCDHEVATPKAGCNACGSRNLETITLPTEGTLFSETTVAVAPQGFEGGYRVGVVDLGTTRVTARLEDECDAEIDDHVELTGVLEVDEPVPVFG